MKERWTQLPALPTADVQATCRHSWPIRTHAMHHGMRDSRRGHPAVSALSCRGGRPSAGPETVYGGGASAGRRRRMAMDRHSKFAVGCQREGGPDVVHFLLDHCPPRSRDCLRGGGGRGRPRHLIPNFCTPNIFYPFFSFHFLSLSFQLLISAFNTSPAA